MAKTVRDSRLDTRTARLKLAVRGEPYYRGLERGLHLGYRRGRTIGRWIARIYLGPRGYHYEPLGVADDRLDADGIEVLDFYQAQNKARERFGALIRAANGLIDPAGPCTVDQAFAEYLSWMEEHRKTAGQVRISYEAFIKPIFGHREVASITTKEFRAWHRERAHSLPQRRTKKGKTAQRIVDMNDPEMCRRRRSTANSLLAVFKAALNRDWREGSVASDIAWRRVQPFPDSVGRRLRWLTNDECRRLMNAAAPDLRRLIQGGLLTGCRYAELTRLEVADFNPARGSVHVRVSKTGRGRQVPLGAEGQAVFARLALGKPGHGRLFVRDDGALWTKSLQARPMREANAGAGIVPAASFHVLRHTYASHAVMNGAPLIVVAKALGHADTRMVERHYGHLAPDFVADAIRSAVPVYGIESADNVVSLANR